MATLEGADTGFRGSVERFIAARPGTSLTSGYRSTDEQTVLWNNAVKKYGSESAARKWVAPPGSSNHNHGFAADLSGIENIADEELAKFGLYRPMSWEPWHVEPLGHRGDKKSHTIPPGADPKTFETLEQFDEVLASMGAQPSTVGAPQTTVGAADLATGSPLGNDGFHIGSETATDVKSATTPAIPGATGQSSIQTDKLDDEQKANAATIIQVGRSRGLSDRAIQIGIATALQESGLRNLDYGDRDSRGLFQQRPSQGWGTVAQVTNPIYSANKFFDALQKVPGYESMPLTQAAQAVQRSGFPTAYAKWESLAGEVVGAR